MLGFEAALNNLKSFRKVRRCSWADGDFLFRLPEGAAIPNLAEFVRLPVELNKVKYTSQIYMFKDGSVGLWSALQDDLLADDWDVLPISGEDRVWLGSPSLEFYD